MRIRKFKSTKNEYVFAGGVWVRNFAKWGATPLSETSLMNKDDRYVMIHNEYSNKTFNLENIAETTFNFPNVVIVSDGFDFANRHKLILDLPEGTCVIGVNRSLNKWGLLDTDQKRGMNFYVVNNPYEECMFYMPKRYFPACVASTRTNSDFVGQYPGRKFLYDPIPDREFGFMKNQKYYVDDYRNPICAAIHLSYRFGAQKILLLCCDDSFKENKVGATLLDNGLFAYPQQLRSHEIIDANLFWLNKLDVKIADYSSGPIYKNSAYIAGDDEAKAFFHKD